jgi:hypothetical protein
MYCVYYYDDYVGVVDNFDEAFELVKEVYGEPIDESRIGIDIEERAT